MFGRVSELRSAGVFRAAVGCLLACAYWVDGAGVVQVSAMTVQASSASLTSSSTKSQRFEAESAELMGGAVAAHVYKGYTGLGYVTDLDATHSDRARVIFAVNVPKDGTYAIDVRYSDGLSSDALFSIEVNGIRVQKMMLRSTGSWSTWKVSNQRLALRSGLNTVALVANDAHGGAANLDSITVAGLDNVSQGANLPYVEYEAESGQTNGAIIGPGRDYLTLASEASGRRAVELNKTGQYVQIKLSSAANAMVIRYAIPDSKSGGGITAPLSLYVNGHKQQDLSLTSKYSWVYGDYPWSNDPSQGNAHHFFDEVHLMFPHELPAGTTIRLQRDPEDTAAYYSVDLLDMEQVAAPYREPKNYISVTQFGAVPNSSKDASGAFMDAIETAEAENKGVWIPPGTYNIVSNRISISGRVTIRGAGPWYSTLVGPNAGFEGEGGTYGFYDFAIMGTTNVRDDNAPDNGFDDNLGTDSIIQNVWIEHKKCGAWINWPTSNLYIVGSRIRDTMADGVNFAGGTNGCMAEDNELRNTGDDSLAIWSSTYKTTVSSVNDIFRYNTIQSPWFANGIGLYGGRDSAAYYNTISDTVGCGGGINISTQFTMEPFAGTVRIEGNKLKRTGGFDGNHDPYGAIWLNLDNGNIGAQVNIEDNTISDSTNQGIEIYGSHTISHLLLKDDVISGAGTYGIEILDGAQGTATLQNVTVSGAKQGGFDDSTALSFHIVKRQGNTGW